MSHWAVAITDTITSKSLIDVATLETKKKLYAPDFEQSRGYAEAKAGKEGLIA